MKTDVRFITEEPELRHAVAVPGLPRQEVNVRRNAVVVRLSQRRVRAVLQDHARDDDVGG